MTLVFSLLCTTTFAATLKGTITDGDTVLEKVTVTLGSGNSANSKTSGESGYKFTDFVLPEVGGSVHINTTHADYIGTVGAITLESGGKLFYNGIRFGSVIDVSDTAATYTLNMTMKSKPVPIINGKVYFENENGEEEGLAGVEVSTTGFWLETVTTDSNGEFILFGYLGTAEDSREYDLTFHKDEYKDETETIEVEGEMVEMDSVLMENPNLSKKRQDQLTAMTGFKCHELMPKYLVGANCVENSTLEGDATDLAAWIQKFGGKITGMIGMLTVVLIVWNAFNIVTAAGDTDQIKKGKDGIKWTVLGLAVTMFAYIIVKTVIVLTYSS